MILPADEASTGRSVVTSSRWRPALFAWTIALPRAHSRRRTGLARPSASGRIWTRAEVIAAVTSPCRYGFHQRRRAPIARPGVVLAIVHSASTPVAKVRRFATRCGIRMEPECLLSRRSSVQLRSVWQVAARGGFDRLSLSGGVQRRVTPPARREVGGKLGFLIPRGSWWRRRRPRGPADSRVGCGPWS